MRFEFFGLSRCPHCSNSIDFATDVANLENIHICISCGAPRPLNPLENEFTVLGLSPHFGVKLSEAQTKYIQLSKKLHPDRFQASKPDWVPAAQLRMGLLNKALWTFKNPGLVRAAVFRTLGRLDLKSGDICLNGKRSTHAALTDQHSSLPLELASEWFDIQEELENLSSSDVSLMIKVKDFTSKLDQEVKKTSDGIVSLENRFDSTLPKIDEDALLMISTLEMRLNTLQSLKSDLVGKVEL